jgi:hypothetical protein
MHDGTSDDSHEPGTEQPGAALDRRLDDLAEPAALSDRKAALELVIEKPRASGLRGSAPSTTRRR